MKVQSQNGGVILERDVPIGHVLGAGIVADRLGAMDSLNAAHSLGRVQERGSRKSFGSYFCSEFVNRWCTNVMLARSNARDRVQKSHGPHTEFISAPGLFEAVTLGAGRDLNAGERV